MSADNADLLLISVGGIPYSLAVSDILKHPTCFFACLIKKEWQQNRSSVIDIERDGRIFKYVYAFLVNGHLPRDIYGALDIDAKTLEAVSIEADFFGLLSLKSECEINCKTTSGGDALSYMTLRKYSAIIKRFHQERISTMFEIDDGGSSELIATVRKATATFCIIGNEISYYLVKDKIIHKSSTVASLCLDELIQSASQSTFGRGTETLTDTAVRNSYEIPADHLNADTLTGLARLMNISALAPTLDLELRPYKLVIYQEGGHFKPHRDTVRGENHIGTLVLILNSDYTGGELEVSHGGQVHYVTGVDNWVAMYGDCLHKINPVTSGTRVSLIYDIYGTPVEYSEEQVAKMPRTIPAGNKWEPKSKPPELLSDFRSSEQTNVAITEAMAAELVNFDTVILCLTHLYPECQASPAYLKGGDRALFDLLNQEYDVTVVAATIYREDNREYYDETANISCRLFSPAIVRDAIVRDKIDNHFYYSDKQPGESEGKTKIVIAAGLDSDYVLDYSPYIDHTGNQSQAEETLYLVAGLQVRKRAV